MKSVGNNLGSRESTASCSFLIFSAGPISLSNNKPKLGNPGLGLPLLKVRPPHPLLSLPRRFIFFITQFKPVFNGVVLRHPGPHLVSSSIQTGQFFLFIQYFPFTGPKKRLFSFCILMSYWLTFTEIKIYF